MLLSFLSLFSPTCTHAVGSELLRKLQRAPRGGEALPAPVLPPAAPCRREPGQLLAPPGSSSLTWNVTLPWSGFIFFKFF